MFSRISSGLSKKPAVTLPQLHQVIHESFSPEPITIDMANLCDVKSWITPHVSKLINHSRHHAFRFKFSSGVIKMCYRNWSKAEPKEWKPAVSILNEMPVGMPALLRPDYRKCPTVEELGAGLVCSKVRLAPKEIEWWSSYIDKQKSQRLTMTTLTDDELKVAGAAAFSLVGIRYRQQEQVEDVNDDVTEKRIKDIDDLIEKTNTFPDVSIRVYNLYKGF